jgi:hypothetical protein
MVLTDGAFEEKRESDNGTRESKRSIAVFPGIVPINSKNSAIQVRPLPCSSSTSTRRNCLCQHDLVWREEAFPRRLARSHATMHQSNTKPLPAVDIRQRLVQRSVAGAVPGSGAASRGGVEGRLEGVAPRENVRAQPRLQPQPMCLARLALALAALAPAALAARTSVDPSSCWLFWSSVALTVNHVRLFFGLRC